jgi:phosphoglycolate phosphatase-like HAD superfamily hydrolase
MLAAETLGLLGESWMIGDTDSDVGAGHAAGCMTALIEYPGTVHKRSGEAAPDVLAPSLAECAQSVLDLRSR